MSEHDDADLIERIHKGLREMPTPEASPRDAMARGRQRRRVALARTVLVVAVLAAAVLVPIGLLSGLRGGSQAPGGRALPPTSCPAPIPSPAPPGGISCQAAVQEAWSGAPFIRAASRAEARAQSYAPAPGYAVPAWSVSFDDARYVAGKQGCSSSGVLTHYTLVMAVVKGQPLAFDRPPLGCHVDVRFIQHVRFTLPLRFATPLALAQAIQEAGLGCLNPTSTPTLDKLGAARTCRVLGASAILQVWHGSKLPTFLTNDTVLVGSVVLGPNWLVETRSAVAADAIHSALGGHLLGPVLSPSSTRSGRGSP